MDKPPPITKCTLVPLDQLTSTKGKDLVQIYRNRWWVVTPNDEALFYGGRSPQCNMDRRIAERFVRDMYPTCEARLIPEAFVSINCGDFDYKKL